MCVTRNKFIMVVGLIDVSSVLWLMFSILLPSIIVAFNTVYLRPPQAILTFMSVFYPRADRF